MAIKTSQSFSKFLACFLIFLLVFQSVGYVYGVSIVCLQSSEAIYPPYFDSATGYCVTYPINENGDCPTGYIFNTALNKCVSFPACDDPNYVYDLSSKSCVPIGSVSVGGEGEYLDPDKPYCGVDLNNDGDLSQNEIFPCIQTPQGMLCSYGQAECSAQYSPPTCPSGGSYNPSTGKCEANSTPMPINDIKQVVQHVSESRGYNPPSFRSLSLFYTTYPVSITEDGRNMIWAMGWCTGDLDQYSKYRGCHSNTWTVTIVRPEAIGYAGLDILGGNDRAYFYINGVLYHSAGKCCGCGKNLTSVFRSMPPGTTVTLTITACDGSGCCSGLYARFRFTLAPGAVAVDCPSGYSYNPGTGKCEANPICSQGTFQNGQCFTGYTCPLGNYQCHQVNDKWLCSPTQCSSVNDVEDEEPDLDPTGLIDDGERAEDGTCLGTIYIFNGFKMRCRKAGVQTGFQNCCDEAQGRVYDSTGSFDTFTSIKNAITAIMFSKKIVEMGYYAEKVAKGVYTLEEAGDLLKIKDSAGNIIKTFQKNVLVGTKTLSTPEYVALKDIQQGMDTTTAIKQATTGYVEQYTDVYGGDVALAVINLAMGQLIDDPVLQATVNLATTVVLASGVFNNVGLALSNPTLTIAMGVIQLGLALFMGGCDSQDVITSTLNESRRCHYVGDRCVKKWFGKCVQKIKVYCCFNSKLARIIHEQGRPQLSTFGASGGWGSAKHPNCRGFTPEEFQAIDFGRIDLSEYYGDIQRNIRQTIKTDVNTQIEDTYQGLQEGVRPNE